jgi:hypothetical protein
VAETIELVGPDGIVLNRPYERLTDEDAYLTRAFYRMMRRRGYVPMLRCVRCGDLDRHDGTRGEVTPTQVRFECRCRFSHYVGADRLT